jgi:hypothetical protein
MNHQACTATLVEVPAPILLEQHPHSSNDCSPYIIHLVDRSIHRAAYDMMEDKDIFASDHVIFSQVLFPHLLGHGQKIMYI